MVRAWMRPPASAWLAISISQLSDPTWLAPRGPPCTSYWRKANPCPVTSQLPGALKCTDGIGAASGTHVVPDPMRSMETPRGSGVIMRMAIAVSPGAIPGMLAMSRDARPVSARGLVMSMPGMPGAEIVGFAAGRAAGGSLFVGAGLDFRLVADAFG